MAKFLRDRICNQLFCDSSRKLGTLVALLAFCAAGQLRTAEAQQTVSGSYNTAFDSTAVAECTNLTDESVPVRMTVRRSGGEEVNSIQFTLAPGALRHVILNEFRDQSGSGVENQYGTYLATFQSTDRDALACTTMTYRFTRNGEINYAIANNAKRLSGTSFGLFNTFNPSPTASGPTLNWLTLQNPTEARATFQVSIYVTQDSREQAHEQRITLGPGQRFDIAAGHQFGAQRAGLYSIVPDDLNRPYIAYLSRFAPDDAGAFAFAFQQIPSAPLSHQRLTLSTTAGATNWISFANVSDQRIQAWLTIRDESGRIVWQDPTARIVDPHTTDHVLVNPLLDPFGTGRIGSADLEVINTHDEADALLAESSVYGYGDRNEPESVRSLRWAYSLNGTSLDQTDSLTALGDGGSIAFVPVNTFLRAANWLSLSGHETEPQSLPLSYRGADGRVNKSETHAVRPRAVKSVPLHEAFGPSSVGTVQFDRGAHGSASQDSNAPDQLLRVYYRSDGTIGSVAPVPLMNRKKQSEGSIYSRDRQIPQDRLFQISPHIFNADRVSLTTSTANVGQVVTSLAPRRLAILPGQVQSSSKITLRFALPASHENFWVFASDLKVSGANVRFAATLYSKDGGGVTLERRELSAQSLTTDSEKFLNLNLTSSRRVATVERQILLLTFESGSPGAFPAGTVIEFSDPLLVRKLNPLQPGVVVNYIDAETVLETQPAHDAQLRELASVGHRLWVIGHRTINPYGVSGEELANRTTAAIAEHATLANGKYILGHLQLHSRAFCDNVYYLDRGADTFSYEPVYRLTHSGGIGTRPDSNFTVVRENCVDPQNSSDPRHAAIQAELDELFRVMDAYGDRLAGVYLVDEAASLGLPVRYLEQIYRAITVQRPGVPLFLTHSFYIASPNLADTFDPLVVKRFYAPSTADIFFFDHYSLPALKISDNSRQVRMLEFLERFEMLTKPYVKLFGTTINDAAPCDSSAEVYARVYDLTVAAKSGLTEDSQTNWQNLGFWAFFNKEARLPAVADGTQWTSTLAWQENGFCGQQYRAAVTYSREYRFQQ